MRHRPEGYSNLSHSLRQPWIRRSHSTPASNPSPAPSASSTTATEPSTRSSQRSCTFTSPLRWNSYLHYAASTYNQNVLSSGSAQDPPDVTAQVRASVHRAFATTFVSRTDNYLRAYLAGEEHTNSPYALDLFSNNLNSLMNTYTMAKAFTPAATAPQQELPRAPQYPTGTHPAIAPPRLFAQPATKAYPPQASPPPTRPPPPRASSPSTARFTAAASGTTASGPPPTSVAARAQPSPSKLPTTTTLPTSANSPHLTNATSLAASTRQRTTPWPAPAEAPTLPAPQPGAAEHTTPAATSPPATQFCCLIPLTS